jgi:type IV fimbrial biogenesis protein FimT
MTQAQGFTLLEMLIVVFVAALLFAIGVPSFRSLLADQRASSSINELVASFRLARSEAIKTARSVTVCKSDDGATCGDAGVEWEQGWIVFVNTTVGTPDTVDAGDLIIRVSPRLPDNFTLRPTGDIDAFLSYRPTGSAGTTAQNMNGTLTLCDAKEYASERALNVTASGSTNVSHEAAYDGGALDCP